MRRLLVLRPEPGASATAQRARALGLTAVAAPLFEIEPLEWDVPEVGGFDGLLLTSANAVRHSGERLRDLRGLPVYAVGEATAEAAREAGFSVAATGDGGVDRLLGSIDQDLKLLHLCGEDRRDPVETRQRITNVPVYRARPLDSPDLSAAEGAVALIHSPRAGRRFAELIRNRNSIVIAAISPAAAESVGSGWAAAESAPEPDDDALLALAVRLCDKPAPK
ncbi:MAG TPA: uroporphyrinogen-III synthase [Sphingomicrobium sp.]|nr:uroporphyrinogen-III synthase [Sphingomicrobium sp.]